MTEASIVRPTLRAYATVLLALAAAALFWRTPAIAAGRTGTALLAAWHGGFLTAPLAAAVLATAALWATHALRTRPIVALPEAARRGQGVRMPLGMAAVLFVLVQPAGPFRVTEDLEIAGAALCALAFPALIAERVFARAPDAADLRALLLLPILSALLCGLSLIAAGLGVTWAAVPPLAVRLFVGAVALELFARACGRWFLPPPPAAHARPATRSLLAAILAGVFGGGGAGAPVRAQIGLDFSRSFALRYLRAAALPATAALALVAFALSGLKQVSVTERAVYERLGDPVRVLQPGLHLVLPWPLGRLRRTELDVVHSLPLGDGAQAAAAVPGAEAPADPSQDRLWSGTHPNEAAFLIASRTGFQVISADLRILWRVGPADADARASVYASENPETLLRATAARLLTDAFARRTLDDVLGAPEKLRTAAVASLTADDGLRRAGIETLDLVVEAVHPPAEASAAYHAVQAAAIGSRTEIAVAERAARATANAAEGEARTRADAAHAHAAEIAGAATADATKFAAEREAALAGESFLLERRLAATTQAAGTAHLTLIDPGLASATVDLRPEGRVPATVQTED